MCGGEGVVVDDGRVDDPWGEHSCLVDEFFDVDKSRSIPPARWSEAAKLLEKLADPDRGFDVVVIGEPRRAFYGNQFGNAFPLFEHYGVELWVPEVGGPIDPANEAHDVIMSTFGSISKGERTGSKLGSARPWQSLLRRPIGDGSKLSYRSAWASPVNCLGTAIIEWCRSSWRRSG